MQDVDNALSTYLRIYELQYKVETVGQCNVKTSPFYSSELLKVETR